MPEITLLQYSWPRYKSRQEVKKKKEKRFSTSGRFHVVLCFFCSLPGLHTKKVHSRPLISLLPTLPTRLSFTFLPYHLSIFPPNLFIIIVPYGVLKEITPRVKPNDFVGGSRKAKMMVGQVPTFSIDRSYSSKYDTFFLI